MLEALQRGLEQLYRIDTGLDVRDFLIGAAQRAELTPGRAPMEQLFVHEDEHGLDLALFLDESVLETLLTYDPRRGLSADNLEPFLLALEGVSHFVYVAYRAQTQRPVTALELELQAEVDKFATCLLTEWPKRDGRALAAFLSDGFVLAPDLDAEERDRYAEASARARDYTLALHERYDGKRGIGGLLDELRRFYRLGAQEKLAHIAAR